jgi:hypothetical protein
MHNKQLVTEPRAARFPTMMRSVSELRDFVQDLLVTRPVRPLAGIATHLVLFLLFCLGIVHWIVFFDFGRLNFQTADWWKEYLYYSVIQQALTAGTIPYHVDQTIQYTDRFLALPELVRSPHVVLLRFMTINTFVVVNTLIMYAVGFAGCLLLRRHYGLSLMSFLVLYFVFQFNGYITSHLATGHSMWNGYFLMPFYCYYVLRLCEPRDGTPAHQRIALKLGLTLFVMNLQGAFHMYIWNALFLGLLALFNARLARPVMVALLFSGVLSSFIFLPAAITFWNADHLFLTGYPTVGVLVEAFVYVRKFDLKVSPATALIGDVGWWEYDMFIGVLAFAAVIYLGIWLRWRAPQAWAPALKGTEYRQLDWPMIVLSVMSMGAFYALIAFLPLPLLNSERVPSRFLITPFLFLLFISCIRLDRVLAVIRQARGPLPLVTGLMTVGILQTAFELASHSKAWSVDKWPAGDNEMNLEIRIIEHLDAIYYWTVQGSAVISVLALAGWVYCYFRPTVLPRA